MSEIEETSRLNTWAQNSVKETPLNINQIKFEDTSKKTDNSYLTRQDQSPNQIIKVYFKHDIQELKIPHEKSNRPSEKKPNLKNFDSDEPLRIPSSAAEQGLDSNRHDDSIKERLESQDKEAYQRLLGMSNTTNNNTSEKNEDEQQQQEQQEIVYLTRDVSIQLVQQEIKLPSVRNSMSQNYDSPQTRASQASAQKQTLQFISEIETTPIPSKVDQDKYKWQRVYLGLSHFEKSSIQMNCPVDQEIQVTEEDEEEFEGISKRGSLELEGPIEKFREDNQDIKIEDQKLELNTIEEIDSDYSKKFPIVQVEPAKDDEMDYFDDDELEDDDNDLLNFKSFMRSRIFLDDSRKLIDASLIEYQKELSNHEQDNHYDATSPDKMHQLLNQSYRDRANTNKSKQDMFTKVFENEQELDKQFIRIDYVAEDDTDYVDKLLEKFIKQHNVTVPIKRIEGHQYLFGTKMISAKVRNGILQVRVGGGYMSIGEFVDKHSILETQRLKLKMTKTQSNLDKVVDQQMNHYQRKKFLNC